MSLPVPFNPGLLGQVHETGSFVTMSKLAAYTVQEIPSKPEILTVTATDSILNSFRKLFKANVLSAPVIDKEGRVVGLIDLVDVVVFTIAVCKTSQELVKMFSTEPKPSFAVHFEALPMLLNDQEFADLSVMPDLFNSTELQQLEKKGITLDSTAIVSSVLPVSNHTTHGLDFSGNNPVQTIAPTAPLEELVNKLSKYHRVLVMDGDQLVNYITQSDLLKFLQKLDIFGDQTLESIGAGESDNIVSIDENARAIEAFKLIVLHHTSGVAVVDKDGKLVGNVSAQDIRGVGAAASFITRLYRPYQEYFQGLPDAEINPHGFLAVNAQTSLKSLVAQMLEGRRHHAYITDGDYLKGVISAGDLLRFV